MPGTDRVLSECAVIIITTFRFSQTPVSHPGQRLTEIQRGQSPHVKSDRTQLLMRSSYFHILSTIQHPRMVIWCQCAILALWGAECEEKKLVWEQFDRIGQRCWLRNRSRTSCLWRKGHLIPCRPLGLEARRGRYNKRRNLNLSCTHCPPLEPCFLHFPFPVLSKLPGPAVCPAPRLTQSLKQGGWFSILRPQASNTKIQPAIWWGAMGPSTEHSPSKASQNTVQRSDYLKLIAALRPSHQENPAS